MKLSLRHLNILIGVSLVTAIGFRTALAQPEAAPLEQASPLHPTFALLDSDGKHVLEGSNAVSTMKTCGQCHDTAFIQSHAFHSDLGLSDYLENGSYNSSTGTFGKWDPLTYRYLSQPGDERLDLSTAEWLMLYGSRVVGGGPATVSRDGKALTELKASKDNPETAILKKGTASVWNWNESGTMEMNCFLCHLESPNVAARADAIHSGDFGGANTAALLGLNIVTKSAAGWTWNADAFAEDGTLKHDFVKIQDPTNANCAACHGEVHTDADTHLTIAAGDLNYPQTATTGQVISPQKISDSGVNLSGKDELDRSWDIHAERQLQCTDCHSSLNNPARVDEAKQKSEPGHLIYDPRSLDIGEYLKQPDHNIARGQSAQYNVAPELKGSMRRCNSCHDADTGHADWLPYIDAHMASVACETCHIPQMYAPAIESYDWTVLTLNKEPHKVLRGVDGDPNADTSLVTGYQPVLLNRTNIDGQQILAPYNLITTYYWVYDDANGNKRPVRLFDLGTAYFENDRYAADILSVFDANYDGRLDDNELKIDSSLKEETVQTKLASLGLNNPRIEGLVQPYSINHNVTRGENAVNDCTTCHNAESRITQSMKISDYAPAGTLPAFDTANNVSASGEIVKDDDGAVYYHPFPAADKMYVFGSNRVNWIDGLGAWMFVGSFLGVIGHGTLRYLSARKQVKSHARTERIYMYESYRRFWHWLQTASIVLLLFTGLIVHRPDLFGVFSFRGVVVIHNVLAVILVINAFLSLFYHLTTARIQEFIPRPYGFFDDAFVQAKYYLTGIFKGEAHPFEKRPNSRMNPIQKATYFMILNVLLPLQIITGASMWAVQKYPNILGGLPFLAPVHSLTAWMFATFILVHVYMTTTGATPLEATRAMITGYEEVEVHH